MNAELYQQVEDIRDGKIKDEVYALSILREARAASHKESREIDERYDAIRKAENAVLTGWKPEGNTGEIVINSFSCPES